MSRFFACAILVALVGSACGDDDRPPPAGTDAGPRPDAGPRDGGPDTGPPPDTGLTPDAGPVMLGTCTFDMTMDVFKLGDGSRDAERLIGLAASGDRFAVVWADSLLGVEDVYGQIIPPSGALGAPMPIVSDPFLAGAPTIISNATGWSVAWYDNSPGNYEVQTRAVGPDLGMPGPIQRVSTNMVRDDSPALAARPGGGSLLAWGEDDPVGMTRVIKTRPLGTLAMPGGMEMTASDPAHAAPFPVLTAHGDDVLLGYADTRPGMQHVYLRRLDMMGTPLGAALAVDSEGNTDGTLDIASGMREGEASGAIVFGVIVGGSRHEVRWREILADGTPAGSERILTLAPEQGADPSITAFAGGWVVTYRVLADDGLTEPILRMALVDGAGAVLETVDLLPVAMNGGRPTVRASDDGRTFAIAWADADGPRTDILAMRVRCE